MLFRFIPDFILNRFVRAVPAAPRKPCLDSLSNDVLVDGVFCYLDIEDVLCLRRVSMLYYYLSHHPVIWKRFLRMMPIPLPPLPPTARFSLGGLSGLEAERIIVRALSLDDNWRKTRPVTYHNTCTSADHDVLSMAIVPGGTYMVASLADRSRMHHTVMVYALEHRKGPVVPLARLQISSKAFHIRAKFLTVNNVQGLAISFVQRQLKNPGEWRSRLNPSWFSGDYEVECPVPVQYENSTFHLSLESLQTLEDCVLRHGSPEYWEFVHSRPPPFCRVGYIKSSHVLCHPMLEEVNGEPMVATIIKPNSIAFKNLNTGVNSTLKCAEWSDYALFQHKIHAVRVLPQQAQVFVVREVMGVTTSKLPIYPLEIYPIPEQSGEHHALDRIWINDAHVTHFQLSDDLPLPDLSRDKSIQPTLPGWTEREPAPISIYARTTKPDGMSHITVWPKRIEFPPSPVSPASALPSSGSAAPPARRGPTHYFTLDCSSYQTIYDFSETPKFGTVKIFPGAHRALMFSHPPHTLADAPKLLQLWSYVSPEIREKDDNPSPEDLQRRALLETVRIPRRENALAALGLPACVRANLEKGVTAVAWDETIGRVCIAAKEHDEIVVLDFAQAPKEDTEGERLPLPLKPT